MKKAKNPWQGLFKGLGYCDICGKPRGSNYRHDRCSRIRQQRAQAAESPTETRK